MRLAILTFAACISLASIWWLSTLFASAADVMGVR